MSEKENPFKLDVVSVRLVKDAPFYSKERVDSPEKAVKLLGKELSEMDREVMCVINMTNKCVPINCSFVSMGTINASLTSPREMIKSSILSNAAGLIIMHNHPSGEVQPSTSDILITKRLAEVCNYVGIDLWDHIIVGGGNEKYFSFSEERIMPNLDRQAEREQALTVAAEGRKR